MADSEPGFGFYAKNAREIRPRIQIWPIEIGFRGQQEFYTNRNLGTSKNPPKGFNRQGPCRVRRVLRSACCVLGAACRVGGCMPRVARAACCACWGAFGVFVVYVVRVVVLPRVECVA